MGIPFVLDEEISNGLNGMQIHPFGMCKTPSGLVLVACRVSHCIYSFDHTSGKTERVGGSICESGTADGDPLTEARLNGPRHLLYTDWDGCLLIGQEYERIRRLPLPARLLHATDRK